MNPSDADELNSRYKTAISIEIAVLILVASLALTAWFMPLQGLVDADLTPVWVLILFVAAGSFVLRRSLLKWERLRDRKLLHGTAGLLKTLQNNTVLLSGIALLIAIAGFAATIVSGDRFDMFRAAAVAIILLAVNFPRRTVWSRIVDTLSEV